MDAATSRRMLTTTIIRVVDFCTRYSWLVIVLALALAALSAVYTARDFAIKTDVTDLFPSDLPWAQRAFNT
jgi:predicted RND superfamily exporter protein